MAPNWRHQAAMRRLQVASHSSEAATICHVIYCLQTTSCPRQTRPISRPLVYKRRAHKQPQVLIMPVSLEMELARTATSDQPCKTTRSWPLGGSQMSSWTITGEADSIMSSFLRAPITLWRGQFRISEVDENGSVLPLLQM